MAIWVAGIELLVVGEGKQIQQKYYSRLADDEVTGSLFLSFMPIQGGYPEKPLIYSIVMLCHCSPI